MPGTWIRKETMKRERESLWIAAEKITIRTKYIKAKIANTLNRICWLWIRWTELLRLLLPLNDRVRSSSPGVERRGDTGSERRRRPPPQTHQVARRRRRPDPRTSPDRSIGSSDGRCVQRAGTWSTRAVDPRLPGIPRSRGWLQAPIPITGGGWEVSRPSRLWIRWTDVLVIWK